MALETVGPPRGPTCSSVGTPSGAKRVSASKLYPVGGAAVVESALGLLHVASDSDDDTGSGAASAYQLSPRAVECL